MADDKTLQNITENKPVENLSKETQTILPQKPLPAKPESKTIQKEIRDLISNEDKDKEKGKTKAYSKKEKEEIIKNLEKEMMESARKLDFERATELRDMIFELKSE